MANNALCGLYEDDEDDIILDNGELRPQRGTYTTEGIAKLCEGLKGSAVTSLECAAAPRVSCQRPLTQQTLCCSPACAFLISPAPVTHSVGYNCITGDAANHLAKVVLEHAAMTEFCGISLTSLRENSITELDLNNKGVGMPGAIVLSKLLPSAAALKSLKCACRPKSVCFPISAH